MMRRDQAWTAAAAPAATCMPTMQRAAAPRAGQQLSARIDALARLPRGQLAHAGDTLLAVQRAYGNHHLWEVVRQARAAPVIQAKLMVGPAGDRYEREADRVAQQVGHGATPDRAATVRSRRGAGGQAVATGVGQAIQRERGRGQSLPERHRARMEQALGTDLGAVRLHTDAQADRLNSVLRSRAFTTGQDVFLRRGEAALSTGSGRALIAHELTHVAQQTGSAPVIQRQLVQIGGDPDHLHDDKTGIMATKKAGSLDLYVGDTDGQDYKIETGTNGEQTFVLDQPGTGFFVTNAPSTFTLTSTPVLPTTTAPPTSNPPLPAWNPPAVSNYWTSPRGQTTLSFSPGGRPYRPGGPAGKYAGKNRRKAGGYDNPGQFHTNMLPLWRAAALSPVPSAVTNDTKLRVWLKKPKRRLQVTSPGRSRTKVIKGYQAGGTRSAVVLGHQPSAGTHFNAPGHTQPRPSNFGHNRSLGAYHGLEDAGWSAASGASEPRDESPRPDRGSHPTFYDPSAAGFTGGPWPTYALESDQGMVNYIEAKLNAVATTAASDPEYQRAVIELANLKTTYTTALAKQLLGVIQQKNW